MSQVADTAVMLLGKGASGPTLWRHTVLQVLDTYESARRRGEIAAALVTERPALTHDTRVDAGLAALIDHLAERVGWDAPAWTREPGRHAGGWLVSGIPGVRDPAEAETPPSFRAHGVLVTSGALERA